MGKFVFKRSESFYIRDGWFEKAINVIHENEPNSIFHKNDGITYLGIGSNMVKGLKYWLTAAGIISGKESQLTEFGRLLYTYDQYLDHTFSWFMIHYNLVTNIEECPIFHMIFTRNFPVFEKSNAVTALYEIFETEDEKVNRKYIDADLSTFTKSYVNETVIENPEDNYACPLAELKLLKKEKNKYSKKTPSYRSLSYLAVYYALTQMYDNAFDIEDSMKEEDSPLRIFNLDKYMYMQYLDEMRRNQLVTINKTAGLNTVYFEEKLTLEDIFRKEFEK